MVGVAIDFSPSERSYAVEFDVDGTLKVPMANLRAKGAGGGPGAGKGGISRGARK